jgi:DNA-directed RNA polymerase specialized sigma24 family protein
MWLGMGTSDVELLVLRAAAGDELAWQELWVAIEPDLQRLVRNPRFLGRVGLDDDDRNNIVLDTISRLAANQRKRLCDYVELRADNPTLRFISWLRVVAKRVGIDYQRGHPRYLDRRRDKQPASTPGKWIVPGTLPPDSQLGRVRPPFTSEGTAGQVAVYATATLPDDQRRALELWVHGDPYDAIAHALGLGGPGDAERKVRAAIERLRRHFRDGGDA